MRVTSIVATLAFSSSYVVAIPPSVHPNTDIGLRLIKTSEADPGVWVTEDQKIEDYVTKNIHFIDITDITVRTLHDKEERALIQRLERNNAGDPLYYAGGITNPSTRCRLPFYINPSNRGKCNNRQTYKCWPTIMAIDSHRVS